MKTTINNFVAPSIANFFDYFNLSLDILMPNDGIICIFVVITIICIILLANIMKVSAIMDTDEDEARRKREPINLVYVSLARDEARAVPQPIIRDLNDPTGVRMQSLFPRRHLIHRGGYIGFLARNSAEKKEGGLVTTNTDPYLLDAAEARGQPVLSKGLPIMKINGTSQFICGIVVFRK